MDELDSFFKAEALAYFCHHGAWRLKLGLPYPNFTTSPTVAPITAAYCGNPLFAQQVMVKMSDSDNFPAPCGMALHSLPWFMEQRSLCWSKVLFTI
jgi:hypothetical protein